MACCSALCAGRWAAWPAGRCLGPRGPALCAPARCGPGARAHSCSTSRDLQGALPQALPRHQNKIQVWQERRASACQRPPERKSVSYAELGLQNRGWRQKQPSQPPAQVVAGALPRLPAPEWEKGSLPPGEARSSRELGTPSPGPNCARPCVQTCPSLGLFPSLYPGPSLRASPAYVVWTLTDDAQAKEGAEMGRTTKKALRAHSQRDGPSRAGSGL